MRCSVIILNWNGADMLRCFLPSVISNSSIPECEVIVADNGSQDASADVVSKMPSVRWMPLGQNYGFAEGYNRAIEQVESDYVVLLNSDVEVTKGWLTTLLSYMDAHPHTAACQPKIKKESQRSYFEHAGAAGGYIDIFGYPYCRGRILDQVEIDNGQYDTTVSCLWASGACMCIRAKAYKEVGGLDNGFFAHMEEIDLCWRLNARGYQVACVPDAVVYHVGGASLHYGNPRKTFLNFRNNLLMLYKNMPWYQLIYVLPIRLLLDYAAAGNDVIHGRWKNASAIIQARWAFILSIQRYYPKRKENRNNSTQTVRLQGCVILKRLWQTIKK